MKSEHNLLKGECGGPEISEGLINTPARPIAVDSETWYKDSVKVVRDLLLIVKTEIRK